MASLAETKKEIERTKNDLEESRRKLLLEDAKGRGRLSGNPSKEYEELAEKMHVYRKELRALREEKIKLLEKEGVYKTALTRQIESMEKWGRGVKNLIAGNKELQYTLISLAAITGKLNGLFKLGVGIIKTLYNGLTKTAKFLVSMPIQIGEMAGKMGNDLRKELVEVIGQATENAKEFFDTASNGGTSIKKLGKMMGSREVLSQFQDMNSELVKLFGPGSQGVANAMQQHEQHIQSMGQFAEFFADSARSSVHSVKFLHQMVKGLGMTAEDIRYLSQEALLNGENYTHTFTRIAETADSVSKEFGVNKKRLSMGFFELRKDITQFGHLSDPALMRVAARATQMGISIKDLSGVMKKFDTFENAAQSAAMLQQTFGMNIDAIDLLKAKDPMEIVEMFRKSFLQTGRNFEQMTRQSKDFIAQQTGLAPEVLKQIFNARNLGKSYEEIKKQLKDQKPENQQIAAMKKLDSSVAKVQKTIEGKGFFENFKDGLENTLKYNTELGRSFVSVNKRMEDFYNKGIRFSETQQSQLDDILKPFTSIVNNEILGEDGAFGEKTFDKMKSGVLKNLSQFMNEVFNNPRASVEFLGRRWQKKAREFFSFEKLATDQTFIGKIFKTSGKIIGYFARGLTVALPAIFDTVGRLFTDGLSALDELLDPAKQGNFSSQVYEWLGFTEEQGEEVFAGLARAIEEIQRLFVGDGTDGFIPKAFNKIIGIGTSIGERIADGFRNNKEAINELTDALSFGFYTKFMNFAATSPLFSHLISEKSSREAGAALTAGMLKRETLEKTTSEALNDERLGQASFQGDSEEAENFRNIFLGKAGSLLFDMSTQDLQPLDPNFLASLDPKEKAKLKAARAKVEAMQVDRNAHGYAGKGLTDRESQRQFIIERMGQHLTGEGLGGGSLYEKLQLGQRPLVEKDLKLLGLPQEAIDSLFDYAGESTSSWFSGTTYVHGKKEIDNAFLQAIKKAAQEKSDTVQAERALINKKSIESGSSRLSTQGETMMYTEGMLGVSEGIDPGGAPFLNPNRNPSKHMQSIPGLQTFNPLTGQLEAAHSGEISKDARAHEIKYKLNPYRGTGFDKEKATKVTEFDNAMINRIARLVDDGDNHESVSANDIYALVYGQTEHIKEMREDFNKSLASDKDKSINVIVTMEGHEFVSKAIKIANEQLINPSFAKDTAFTGGAHSSSR